MTPEELELITVSGAVVTAAPDRFGDVFYETLFGLAPQVRALFARDLSEQKGRLVTELDFLVRAARDLDEFTARARDLGRRHVDHGVTAGDYVHVQTALLAGLEAVLGDDWTDAHTDAWNRLYALISETMLDGASGALFSSADRTR